LDECVAHPVRDVGVEATHAQSGNCVEVATNMPGTVAVRDSKDPEGPGLLIPAAEWRAFVRGLKAD
jgi:hypothetical protein